MNDHDGTVLCILSLYYFKINYILKLITLWLFFLYFTIIYVPVIIYADHNYMVKYIIMNYCASLPNSMFSEAFTIKVQSILYAHLILITTYKVFSPFYSWGEWGFENLRGLFKAIHLVNSEATIWNQTVSH